VPVERRKIATEIFKKERELIDLDDCYREAASPVKASGKKKGGQAGVSECWSIGRSNA
jgi:hypothetical protein